jgi:hypothetical protein
MPVASSETERRNHDPGGKLGRPSSSILRAALLFENFNRGNLSNVCSVG